jgi:histone H1/5
MAATAVATHHTPAVGAIKSKGGSKKSAVSASHPTYSEMCVAAITDLKERKGSSRQKIFKWINLKYKLGENARRHVNHALKLGVERGVFTSPTQGRYRLATGPKQEKTTKQAKTATKRTKATSTAKYGNKKSTSKGSPKKQKKTGPKKSVKGAKKSTKKTAKKVPRQPSA